MVFRRFSIASLSFFLLLTGASAIFVYLVSPLRDPAFQPNGGNAGSLLWWLKGVHEDIWELAAIILAGLLSINFTLVLWRWCQSRIIWVAHRYRRILREIVRLMHFMLGIWMWLQLFYLFFIYLLNQWLID
jgi:hypothetical protein